jgi:two-component system response regulator
VFGRPRKTILENKSHIEFLLIEDSPTDVELTLHTFEKHHISNRVLVLRDGVEALDYLFSTGAYEGRASEFPKTILLDLKLPRIDGLEVLRRIKQDPRTRDIPVIAMTSSREERDIVESYRLGVNSYIVKPVDFDQFSEAIRVLGLYWLVLNQPPRP